MISLAVYLSVCLLSTLYDLIDRYKRDMLRLKLSKVQRQMQYEEQQRKLMKNLMSEAYYEDIMQVRGSIDQEEILDDDEDEGNNGRNLFAKLN
jgi:hypothetical protein